MNFIDFIFHPELIDHVDENYSSDSDAKLAEELQFQEAVLSSLATTTITSKANETGESSQGRLCGICLDTKEIDKIYTVSCCSHYFCFDCVNEYVTKQIERGRRSISCPGVDCQSVLELQVCKPFLDAKAIDSWDQALCEGLIHSLDKFYCPFQDCGAMFVIENDGGEDQVIREAVCPSCHRMFCAKCRVPWHPESGCKDAKISRHDVMMRDLAEKNKWRKCPQCKVYVERTEGCPHITCRCGFEFCYGCGEDWAGDHGGCVRN